MNEDKCPTCGSASAAVRLKEDPADVDACTHPWHDSPERAGREFDTQPLPHASDTPIMHRLVQQELEARLDVGIRRYGQPLQGFNGRDAMRDAYDEVLDLSVYLRQAIFERDARHEHEIEADKLFDDYQALEALLAKYIGHVVDREGTDFLVGSLNSKFTDQEWAWLRRLANHDG